MINTNSLRQPLYLKFLSSAFVVFWCLIALFPIFWITAMSLKVPIDAFSPNPLNVILGPETSNSRNSFSILDILYVTMFLFLFLKYKDFFLRKIFKNLKINNLLKFTLLIIISSILFLLIFFLIHNYINPFIPFLGIDFIGYTLEHYHTVWFERGFTNNFKNSILVTFGVVIVSLTFGTLAGYGLARTGSSLAFWILVIALIFRSLPHSILVAGYLPFFINSREILGPLFGDLAPTLFGKPWAVIAVLVAINQPFTIWMMRSFFQNIPPELDEAARVDGCNHFQAFRRVIMPVMWPGVITTGLFSFMLGYNDYLVTSLLLDAQNQTMVPAISGLFNRDTTTTDEIVAITAAVSIIAPLFFLVLFFQRQIVSGLTAGAVKG